MGRAGGRGQGASGEAARTSGVAVDGAGTVHIVTGETSMQAAGKIGRTGGAGETGRMGGAAAVGRQATGVTVGRGGAGAGAPGVAAGTPSGYPGIWRLLVTGAPPDFQWGERLQGESKP